MQATLKSIARGWAKVNAFPFLVRKKFLQVFMKKAYNALFLGNNLQKPKGGLIMEIEKCKNKREIRELLTQVAEGKRAGRSLSSVFEDFAFTAGKAKGSVRNLYYEAVKCGNKNAAFKKDCFSGGEFSVGVRKTFERQEERALLKSVFRLKKRGVSTRKVLKSLAGEDEKLLLRYQNKFRNLIVKSRDVVEEVMREVEEEQGYCYNPYAGKESSGGLLLRLKTEVESLNERLCALEGAMRS
jgi:hypothetical protein